MYASLKNPSYYQAVYYLAVNNSVAQYQVVYLRYVHYRLPNRSAPLICINRRLKHFLFSLLVRIGINKSFETTGQNKHFLACEFFMTFRMKHEMANYVDAVPINHLE